MSWNRSDKSSFQENTKSILNAGAPIAFNPAMANKPYKDNWDIERAYREGAQKVTWVFRCIDAIAGNQARLPMILRKDNSPTGQIVSAKNSLLDIFNTVAVGYRFPELKLNDTKDSILLSSIKGKYIYF